MSNPSIEEILSLIEAGLPAGYGYPSRRKRRRMNDRQLKKEHLPPFTCVDARAQVTLSRPLTFKDCNAFDHFPDCSEHAQCFVELLVDTAESTGCGVFVGAPEFNEPQECGAMSMNGQTVRQEVEDLLRFGKALAEHPVVTEVRLDLQESWHLDKDDEAFVYTSLIFRHNENEK